MSNKIIIKVLFVRLSKFEIPIHFGPNRALGFPVGSIKKRCLSDCRLQSLEPEVRGKTLGIGSELWIPKRRSRKTACLEANEEAQSYGSLSGPKLGLFSDNCLERKLNLKS